MKIVLPEKVKVIINTLLEHGYEAYAVGGCVRDSALAKIPKDWDITTSATPNEVKTFFSHTVDTGIAHGTVTVLIKKEAFEVTTYRIDGEYEDSRHPNEVVYTSNLLEDLKRRDFTVNAMAYNEKEGLIDAFGGLEDIKNKMIRCVGNPMDRFEEDALRMLRAVRFSAQLGFQIEPKTEEAIQRLAQKLTLISAERIQAELIKLLESPHPKELRIAYHTGITKIFFPEFDACMGQRIDGTSGETFGERALNGLQKIRAYRVLRLTMLLQYVGEACEKAETGQVLKGLNCLMADWNKISREQVPCQASESGKKGEVVVKRILKRLKFDNDTLSKVSILVRYHDLPMIASKRVIRYQLKEIGIPLFQLLLEVKEITLQLDKKRQKEMEQINVIRSLCNEIIEHNECVNLKMLAVGGEDLKELGFSQGKEIGNMLEELLFEVLDEPKRNTKLYLKQYCKKRMSTL